MPKARRVHEKLSTCHSVIAVLLSIRLLFLAEELLKSYPQANFYRFKQKPSSHSTCNDYQAKVILVERDFEKWYPSVTVLLEGMSAWKSSAIAKLDQFLGYAGLRCFRKLGLEYLRATNGSDLLEMVILGYGEHYKRMRHLVPRERILNYELGLGWEPLCDFLEKEKPLVKFPYAEVKMITAIMSRLEGARRKLILPFLGLVWAVVMSHFFSAEATICTLDLL